MVAEHAFAQVGQQRVVHRVNAALDGPHQAAAADHRVQLLQVHAVLLHGLQRHLLAQVELGGYLLVVVGLQLFGAVADGLMEDLLLAAEIANLVGSGTGIYNEYVVVGHVLPYSNSTPYRYGAFFFSSVTKIFLPPSAANPGCSLAP